MQLAHNCLQMKDNPGMLERILERPSVENSSASASDGSRKASLTSDLPLAEEPKAHLNGPSQTRILRSAFFDVRLQDSPTGSEVRLRSSPTNRTADQLHTVALSHAMKE